MSEYLEIPLSLGNNTRADELRLAPGFLRRSLNWIYLLDDPDRLHKMPGRSVAATLSGDQATTPKGLVHLQFESGTDQLVLLANSQLYEADAATSLGGWTSVEDQQGAPAAFARSGSYLKTLPDGRNQAILWSGGSSERPLIRDEDGQWRYLSLKKPSAPPTLSQVVTTVATLQSNTDDLSSAGGGDFTTPDNAIDDDKDNFAYAALSAAGTATQRWDFTDAGTLTDGYTLFVKAATSSEPPRYGDAPDIRTDWDFGAGGGGEGEEPVVASLKIEYSINDGAAWTILLEQSAPVPTNTFQVVLPNAGAVNFDQIAVRATLTYTSGTAQVSAYVFEIWASDGAGENAITEGTYVYAVTEVYRKTLSSGKTIVVESNPSDVLSVAVSGTAYGVQLTLPPRANLNADGIADTQISRKIYRSTSTGNWPNLGLIDEIPDITETAYTDTFSIGGTTLGSPQIYVVVVGVASVHAAGQAPGIRDATLYRGAVVAIPEDAPRRLSWSLPGQPEYWPGLAHSFGLLPVDRNEEGKGIVSVNDNLLVFTRNRAYRIRELPFANRANFDLGRLETDIISPNEGLAGTPKAYTTFQSQRGHSLVAWVSDNGIWMTDGSLVTERGLGIAKLSVHMAWERDVDTARLDETELSYDPVLQIIFFDYFDPDGNARVATFHTAPPQWVPTGQDQSVPKWTGPHSYAITDRAVGELSGVLKHWSLSATDSKVYNERTGTDDAGSDMASFADTGWIYPAGPREEFHLFEGSVYHSDWGASEGFNLDLPVRRDSTGVIQPHHESGLSLEGARITDTALINSSGRSVKGQIRHIGKTSSLAAPTRAIGPIVLEWEPMDELEAD